MQLEIKKWPRAGLHRRRPVSNVRNFLKRIRETVKVDFFGLVLLLRFAAYLVG